MNLENQVEALILREVRIQEFLHQSARNILDMSLNTALVSKFPGLHEWALSVFVEMLSNCNKPGIHSACDFVVLLLLHVYVFVWDFLLFSLLNSFNEHLQCFLKK